MSLCVHVYVCLCVHPNPSPWKLRGKMAIRMPLEAELSEFSGFRDLFMPALGRATASWLLHTLLLTMTVAPPALV